MTCAQITQLQNYHWNLA